MLTQHRGQVSPIKYIKKKNLNKAEVGNVNVKYKCI